MLLTFDIAPEAIPEHDDWHTHEHLPERLSIPGFLRGTRWVAIRGTPRYLVLYEVAQLATLTSAAYLERLDNPSAWTTKLMPHYRGMSRGFCTVAGSVGFGMGNVATLLRFEPAREAAVPMRRWLLENVLPALPGKAGIGSVHLLEGAQTPPMTKEQSIRGADAGVGWALLATGYSQEALAGLARTGLGLSQLQAHGAEGVLEAMYRIDYALTHDEVGA
jgi:hypothetical protein